MIGRRFFCVTSLRRCQFVVSARIRIVETFKYFIETQLNLLTVAVRCHRFDLLERVGLFHRRAGIQSKGEGFLTARRRTHGVVVLGDDRGHQRGNLSIGTGEHFVAIILRETRASGEFLGGLQRSRREFERRSVQRVLRHVFVFLRIEALRLPAWRGATVVCTGNPIIQRLDVSEDRCQLFGISDFSLIDAVEWIVRRRIRQRRG